MIGLRAAIALVWVVIVIVAIALTGLALAFAWLAGGSPFPARRRRPRPYIHRRIPGRLVRLEDLRPVDREILGRFRELA